MAAPKRLASIDRAWWLGLVGVVAAGVLVRAAYVFVVLDGVAPGLDAIWYSLQGGSIKDGTGFVAPTSLFQERTIPTAGFPPVYPAYQAFWQWLFGGDPTTVRLAGLIPGAVTIVVVGLAGRQVLGRRGGLIAAFVVALDPSLLAVDGSGMSENVTVPLVAVATLLAYRIATKGLRAGPVIALGLVCGLAALSRQDLLLLLPLAAVPAVVWAPSANGWRRIGAGAALVALAALVVVPWAWRNHREVGSFTVSTLSPSSALAGSNCPDVYAGSSIGSWSYPCVAAVAVPPGGGEVDLAAAQQRAATRFARSNLDRLPAVVAARQVRVWSLWDPRDLARRDADESRRYGWQLAARPIDALFAVVGIAGLAVMVRTRGRRTALFAAPCALVAFAALVSYGNPRFNSIAHPALALGLACLVDRALSRRHPATRPARSAAHA